MSYDREYDEAREARNLLSDDAQRVYDEARHWAMERGLSMTPATVVLFLMEEVVRLRKEIKEKG